MTEEEVAAQIEIRDLIARYNHTGDAEDAGGYAGVFALDGVIEVFGHRFVGREAIHAWKAGRSLSGAPATGPLFRRHHVTTTRITLDGPDRASGLVYWIVITQIGVDHTGFYTDRYVRVDGEWLIAHRQVDFMWRSPGSDVPADAVPPQFRPPA